MTTANEVFRDYETDGVPLSGPHKVVKGDARTWGTGIETDIATLNTEMAALTASDAAKLVAANNLSDLVNAATARANLGVGYGKQSIFVPSTAMFVNSANVAAPAGPNLTATANFGVPMYGYDFPTAQTEGLAFPLLLPKSWDQGNLSYIVWWYQTNAGTGNVEWVLDATCLTAGASPDINWTGGATLTSAGGTSGDVYKSAESSAFAPAGTPSADCFLACRIFRFGSGGGSVDTFSGTARLLGVRILYNTNAANDT